eukprot:scaffold84091_cov31-Attheya_sp.AAC.1
MDFTRKARFAAGGHLTDPPASITYSLVVARNSVRIAFMIAALNDLSVLVADVGNAYLNAPFRENIWFTAGKEFGSRAGTKIVLIRALYGLKTSGAAWRAHISLEICGNLDLNPAIPIRMTRKLEKLMLHQNDILAGANIGQYDLPDSQKAWYMSSDDYVREVVKTVEQKLSEISEQLVSARNSKISGPTSPGYRPELGLEKANYYQNLEMGRGTRSH